jgi:hypothetical protein
MKKLFFAAGAAAMCSVGAAAAIHTPVVIIGCVYAGNEPDTFVLLDVDDVTDGHAVPAGAVYWLSSTRQLKSHIGHKVEVRGTYSLDREFGKTARLTAKTDSATGQQKIGRDNGAKKDELRAVGTTGVFPTEVKWPYRRLEVSSVKMIGASCDVS